MARAPVIVIARSAATKQSRGRRAPYDSGSTRRFASRDDDSIETNLLRADKGFDDERQANRAILAHEDARRDESRRMGKPVRRLRSLLPRQARGRGHGRDSFHRHWLQAARRQDV